MKKERRQMSKRYTKKQITEAIAYWEKQLKAGNYKKLDESWLDYDVISIGDPDDPWDVVDHKGGLGNETIIARNRKTGQTRSFPAEDVDPWSGPNLDDDEMEEAVEEAISSVDGIRWFDKQVTGKTVELDIDGTSMSDDELVKKILDAFKKIDLHVDENPEIDHDEYGRTFLKFKRG